MQTGTSSMVQGAPFSDRLCEAVCFGFCLWTLCSWAVVSAGGTLRTLLGLFTVVVGTVLAGFLVWRRRRPAFAGATPVAEVVAPGSGLPRGVLAAAVAVALGVVFAIRSSESALVRWWWIVGLLGLAAILVLWREDPRPAAPPATGHRREALLWGLAAFCIVVTLVSHRPDIDDAFYIGLAVHAVDAPGWALLGSDPLHGIPELPLHMPLYRLHSFELANAALAKLTGIPAIYCFHWIAASVGALLLPLAHARLFRRLAPGLWLEAVVVLVVLFVAVGETHRWYGNFALVRMWQGKALYLFFFLPLIYAYALELGCRPSRRVVLLLGAAQVSAVGCSASALWGAPLAAALGVISTLRPSRRHLLGLAWGALPTAAVLGVGWSLKRELAKTSRRIAETSTEPGDGFERALHLVLGDARLLSVAIAALLLAWVVSPRGPARRFAAIVPLGGFLLLNPYTEILISAHVTGRALWRALWAVPLPLLMVLVLISPLRLPVPARWRWARFLAGAGLLAAFVVYVPSYSALSEKNRGLRLGFPGLKVPEVEYSFAEALNRLAGPGSLVLAPEPVTAWIPTFHGHADPLVVRLYLRPKGMRNFLGSRNVNRREDMVAFVEGRRPRASELFQEGLDLYPLRGVCLSTRRPRVARQALRQAGFRREVAGESYEIWLRADPAEVSAVRAPGDGP